MTAPAAGQLPEQGHSVLADADVHTAEALAAVGGVSSNASSPAVADAAEQLYVAGQEAISPAGPCGSTMQVACQVPPSLSTAPEAPEAQQGCHPASSGHGAVAAGAAACLPCWNASEQQGLPGESPERLPGVLLPPQPTVDGSATTPAAVEADAAAHVGVATLPWGTATAGEPDLAGAAAVPKAESAVSDAATDEQHSSVIRESAEPEAMPSYRTSTQLAEASGQLDAAVSDAAADEAAPSTISAVAGGSSTVLTEQLSNTATASDTRTGLSQAGAGVLSNTNNPSPVAPGFSEPPMTAGFGLLDAEAPAAAASSAGPAPQGCSLSDAARDPSERLGTTPMSNGAAAVATPAALAAAMHLSGHTAVQMQSTACPSEDAAAVKVLLAPQDSTSGQMEQAAAEAKAAPAPAAGSTALAVVGAGASSLAVSHCNAAGAVASAVPSPEIGPAGSDTGAQDGEGAAFPEGTAGLAATGGHFAVAGPLAEPDVAAAGVSSTAACVASGATCVAETDTNGASPAPAVQHRHCLPAWHAAQGSDAAAGETQGESAGSPSQPTPPLDSAPHTHEAVVSATAAGVQHNTQQEEAAAQVNQSPLTTAGPAAASQPSTPALDGTVAAGWQPCGGEGTGVSAAPGPLEQSPAAAAAEQPCLPAAVAVLQEEAPAGESVAPSSEPIVPEAPCVDTAVAPSSPHTTTAAEAAPGCDVGATWAAAVALVAAASEPAQDHTPAAVYLGDRAAVDAAAAATTAIESAEPQLLQPVTAAATNQTADDAAATSAAALVSLAADFEDGAAAAAAMPKDSLTAQGTLCDVAVPGLSADAMDQPDSGGEPDGLLHVPTAGAAEEAAVDADSEGRVECSVLQQLLPPPLPLQLPCAVDGALAGFDGGVVCSGAEVEAVRSSMQQQHSAASVLSAAAARPDDEAAQCPAEEVVAAGTSARDAASDVLQCSLGLGVAEPTAVHPEEDSVPCAPAAAEHHLRSGIAAAPMAEAAPAAPAAAAVGGSAAAAAPEAAASGAPLTAAESSQSPCSAAAQPAGDLGPASLSLHTMDAVEPGAVRQDASMPVIWARLASDAFSADELGLDTRGTSGEVCSCEQQADTAASTASSRSVPAYSPVDDPAQCTSNVESTAAAEEAVGVTTTSSPVPASSLLDDVSGTAAVLLPVTWPSGVGMCPDAECELDLTGPTRTTAVAAPQAGESCSSANQGLGSEGSGTACSSPTSEHSRVSSSSQQAAEELCGVPVAAPRPAAMNSCCSTTQPQQHAAGPGRSCADGTQQGCTDVSLQREPGVLQQQVEYAASSPVTGEVPQGLRPDSPEHHLPAASPEGTTRHCEQVSALHPSSAADVEAVATQVRPANQADAAAIELELEWVIDALVADVSGRGTPLGSSVSMGSSTGLDLPRFIHLHVHGSTGGL